jgi:hypothetical protein
MKNDCPQLPMMQPKESKSEEAIRCQILEKVRNRMAKLSLENAYSPFESKQPDDIFVGVANPSGLFEAQNNGTSP